MWENLGGEKKRKKGKWIFRGKISIGSCLYGGKAVIVLSLIISVHNGGFLWSLNRNFQKKVPDMIP